jgi:hypothetical protein
MTAYYSGLGVDSWLRDRREGENPANWVPANPSSQPPQAAGCEVVSVLKQAGLTMREVSAQTRMRFGERSPYFVPRTFLYKQKSGITPHICQVVALSEVTGYRFTDWMTICGFNPALILSLQLRIPNERTTMLVSGCDVNPGALYPHRDSTTNRHLSRYCYAKIGSRDAVLYPVVSPGTIVRADRSYSPGRLSGQSATDRIWLVEHPGGTTCCRLRLVGRNEVVLSPSRPPLSPWPLRIPTQVRITGLVDSQLLLFENSKGDPLRTFQETNGPNIPSHPSGKLTFSRFVRWSRCRTGLTFRQAHNMTLRIAELMQNRNFAISIGLLSDYEAINKLPRHIAKIITLCVIYGIDIYDLLNAAGVDINDVAKRGIAMSDRSIRKKVERLSNDGTVLQGSVRIRQRARQ